MRNFIKTTKSLHHTLLHDTLTGLKNRFAFEEEKEHLASPCIALLNVDRFKDINDVYETHTGDLLLQALAKKIQFFFQNSPYYKESYQIGGDEFCILFEAGEQKELLQELMEFQHQISSHHFLIQNNTITISVTIALNTIKPLLENADLSLKYLKKKQTQRIIVYHENMKLKQEAHNNLIMIQKVQEAIKQDQVVPFFQPIVNLKTKRVQKYEALVRLVNGSEVIPPSHFLDIVRKTTLYHDITRIIVEKTIQTAQRYQQYRFSINLSMRDIQNCALIDAIFSLLEQNITVANRIDFELLESEYLHDLKTVKNFIDRLHSYGSLVLIDDFGNGYSNFSYFADLEIDIVKIDGSIINEIATNKRKLHMLKSIIKFAKGMGIDVVAEYVDSKEVVTILQELEITYAQGFFFAKPLQYPLLSSFSI